MTDDLTSQAELNKNELELKKHLRSERVMLLSELTKGLIAVNSGGLIALLAFIGTIAKNGMMHPMLEAFKFNAITAFGTFGGGVVASLFIPVLLVEHSIAVRKKDTPKAKAWLNAAAGAAGVGFAGVIIGVIVLGCGLALAL